MSSLNFIKIFIENFLFISLFKFLWFIIILMITEIDKINNIIMLHFNTM